MSYDSDFPDETFFARMEGPVGSPLDESEYRKLIRHLQRPTDAQITDFSDYVCSAKSWYKHLPLTPPGSRFFFYLDPHAGLDRVVTRTGKVRLHERTQSTEAFHYSWMTTDAYRARFGCLAFACEDGSALFSHQRIDGEVALIDNNTRHPLIQITDVQVNQPPAAVLEAGSCFLTALIHPRATARWLFTRLERPIKVAQAASHPPQPAGENWPKPLERRAALARPRQASIGNATPGADDETFRALLEQEKARLRSVMIDAMHRMREIAYGAAVR
jgi:hypothetical protein